MLDIETKLDKSIIKIAIKTSKNKNSYISLHSSKGRYNNYLALWSAKEFDNVFNIFKKFIIEKHIRPFRGAGFFPLHSEFTGDSGLRIGFYKTSEEIFICIQRLTFYFVSNKKDKFYFKEGRFHILKWNNFKNEIYIPLCDKLKPFLMHLGINYRNALNKFIKDADKLIIDDRWHSSEVSKKREAVIGEQLFYNGLPVDFFLLNINIAKLDFHPIPIVEEVCNLLRDKPMDGRNIGSCLAINQNCLRSYISRESRYCPEKIKRRYLLSRFSGGSTYLNVTQLPGWVFSGDPLLGFSLLDWDNLKTSSNNRDILVAPQSTKSKTEDFIDEEASGTKDTVIGKISIPDKNRISKFYKSCIKDNGFPEIKWRSLHIANEKLCCLENNYYFFNKLDLVEFQSLALRINDLCSYFEDVKDNGPNINNLPEYDYKEMTVKDLLYIYKERLNKLIFKGETEGRRSDV